MMNQFKQTKSRLEESLITVRQDINYIYDMSKWIFSCINYNSIILDISFLSSSPRLSFASIVPSGPMI